jgi:hypothetical protein
VRFGTSAGVIDRDGDGDALERVGVGEPFDGEGPMVPASGEGDPEPLADGDALTAASRNDRAVPSTLPHAVSVPVRSTPAIPMLAIRRTLGPPDSSVLQ